MRAFEYIAPTTLREAVALLADQGDRARPLAGGTDLIVQLRRGVYDLDWLVDVKKIPELNEIACSATEGLTIGAAVPCYRIAQHPEVLRFYPGLVDAVGLIGGTAIQGRATMGGNLCNASPSGDSIPALIVLMATCTIAGPGGMRNVPVEHFCIAPGRNVLSRGEMLVSLHLPPPPAHAGAHYTRFIPRHEMDIAVVGVGASLVLSADQTTIQSARIALGAVAPTPLLVVEAGAALVGRSPTEESFAEAARLAQQACSPITDMRGTLAQRRHLVGVLTRRVLRGAFSGAVSPAPAQGGTIYGR